MKNFESKLEEEFIDEMAELLDEAEDASLALEREPDNSEIIDLIFRISHTIKGSGFVAGFSALSRFAHQYENMLSLIRSRVIKVTPDVIAIIFEVHDTLKAWVEELKTDSLFVAETQVLERRINGVCAHAGRPQPVVPQPQVPLESFGVFEDETPPPPRAPLPKPAPKPAEAPRLAFQKPRILIVDDEVSLTRVFASYLEDLDAEITTANDGRQALAHLKEHHVDLIVTDFMMPHMNGLELIQNVRKSDSTVQVIFVTAAAERSDVIRILNMGAFAFLEKPFEAELLLTHARNALREKFIRDAVVRLTSLNFKAFITSSQLARAQDEKRHKELYTAMQKILDEITEIQNSILKPDMFLAPVA